MRAKEDVTDEYSLLRAKKDMLSMSIVCVANRLGGKFSFQMYGKC